MRTPSESMIEVGYHRPCDLTLLDDIYALDKRGLGSTLLRMVAGERGLPLRPVAPTH